MKNIDLNETWANITREVHCEKPSRSNLIKREFLFRLQILLSQYELAKKEKNKKLMNFYTDVLKIYEKHKINGHIVWEK
jgi:hypothetical protein